MPDQSNGANHLKLRIKTRTPGSQERWLRKWVRRALLCEPGLQFRVQRPPHAQYIALIGQLIRFWNNKESIYKVVPCVRTPSSYKESSIR